MPTNNKFTKVITTKILPITGAVVVAVAVNACKPEPDNTPPPICKCEAGTEHLPADNSCESMNGCLCDHIDGKTTSWGIPITNRSGIDNLAIDGLEAALNSYNVNRAEIIKYFVKEFRIVSGTINTDVDTWYHKGNDGKYIIEMENGVQELDARALFTMLINEESLVLPQVNQSSRDTIRLAKEKVDAKTIGQEVAFQAVGNAHEELLRVMKQEGATLERA